jgi:hypothetical protein
LPFIPFLLTRMIALRNQICDVDYENFKANENCAAAFNVFYSSVGYIKSVCAMVVPLNQDGARTVCSAYGMQLLRLDDYMLEISILSILANDYSSSPYLSFPYWVQEGNSTFGLTVLFNNSNFVREYMPSNTSYNYFLCEYESKS